MKFLYPLVAILLAFNAAAEHTESYLAAARAAAEKGVTLRHGETHALYEYWAAANTIFQCLTGFSHVRLVVGKVQYKERNNRHDLDFKANAWHMISAGTNAANLIARPIKSPYGGTVQAEADTWYPNQYYNYQEREWRRTSRDNRYVYAGQVTTTTAPSQITRIGMSLFTYFYKP
jgi:hypothetical protein